MTIKELYDEAQAVRQQATDSDEMEYVVASVALLSFIEIIIERGKIKWHDDAFELRKIHRFLREHPEQGAKFSKLIEQRVITKGRERK